MFAPLNYQHYLPNFFCWVEFGHSSTIYPRSLRWQSDFHRLLKISVYRKLCNPWKQDSSILSTFNLCVRIGNWRMLILSLAGLRKLWLMNSNLVPWWLFQGKSLIRLLTWSMVNETLVWDNRFWKQNALSLLQPRSR